MQKLPFYDAVFAVTDVAINKGLQRLFAAAPDKIELDIDPDFGVRLTATVGTPTVTLLANDEARVTVPIVEGTYKGETRINKRTGKEETIETKLAGSSLSFTVDLEKLHDQRASLHDRDFTIQQLYLDLTDVRAIDTTNFKIAIEEQDKVASIVNAFVEMLKTTPAGGADGDGHAPARLTLGQVTVPAVFDAAGSPLLPSHGTFSVTLQDSQRHAGYEAVGLAGRVDEERLLEERPPEPRQPASSGDLNFLLMMGGRGLPTDKGAGQFDIPWTPRSPADGKPTHEGVLVISDYLLLDAVTAPIIKSLTIPADKIAVSRGDGTTPAHASLTKPHDLKDGVRLTKFEATMDATGKIVLVVGADKLEPLKFNLFKLEGLSLVVAQERTVALQIGSDDKGDLSVTVVSDKTADPQGAVVGDHELTVAEYLALVGDLIVDWSTLLQAQLKLLDDKDEVAKHLGDFSAAAQARVNQAVQLPGAAVFSFGKPRVEGRLLKYDADYIEMPALETPKAQPFQIGDFPRMGPEGKATSDHTEPVLVGEALVNYRMVDDPDYTGRQAQDNPYYVLRREQFWSRLYRHGWPPHEEVTDTATWRVAMSKEQADSMEKATHMRVTAGCRLAFKDFVSAEVQTEIGNELRMDVETTTRTETEETHQQTINHQASETAYTAALWTIVDRFTLCRRDRYPIKTWDYVHGKDQVEVDVSGGDSPKPPPVEPLTDPLKEEAVGAGAGVAS